MAYDPSPFSSNTIWLDGFSFVFCCCLGGTCTSNPLRDIGCVIMKMIRSTSSTSISGVTLISQLSPSPELVHAIDMATPPSLLLLIDCFRAVLAAAIGAAALDEVIDQLLPRLEQRY